MERVIHDLQLEVIIQSIHGGTVMNTVIHRSSIGLVDVSKEKSDLDVISKLIRKRVPVMVWHKFTKTINSDDLHNLRIYSEMDKSERDAIKFDESLLTYKTWIDEALNAIEPQIEEVPIKAEKAPRRIDLKIDAFDHFSCPKPSKVSMENVALFVAVKKAKHKQTVPNRFESKMRVWLQFHPDFTYIFLNEHQDIMLNWIDSHPNVVETYLSYSNEAKERFNSINFASTLHTNIFTLAGIFSRDFSYIQEDHNFFGAMRTWIETHNSSYLNDIVTIEPVFVYHWLYMHPEYPGLHKGEPVPALVEGH
jgi:hypothetical protein